MRKSLGLSLNYDSPRGSFKGVSEQKREACLAADA
jgi:hypothetical protein